MPSPDNHTPLPSGTVTLVFTDIEGSSELSERFRDAFEPVRQEHFRILRETAARWRGFELKTIGDSLFLAFARASDAVQFALHAQLAFRHTDWSSLYMNPHPELGEMRIRIGMHTGEPFLAAHPNGTADYFGPVVNRAAHV